MTKRPSLAARALALAWTVSCAGSDPGTSAPGPTGPPSDTAGPFPTPTDPAPTLAPPLELCVNEFQPDNARSWQDETGAWPDWIELHNPGPDPVDLRGWALTDDRSDRRKHVFTTSLLVPAGGFLVLSADGAPALGPTHLSFSLDALGEEVALFREDGSAEIVTFGAVVSDLAVARDTDCGPLDAWHHAIGGSPGASNPAP